jgi:arginyl-tRNA synthetase
MVELPEGKMKSREGTVVDADDLIAEVISEARQTAEDRGEPGETPEEQASILQNIALGAIKFFILKVAAKKRMIFNPSDSLDMQGQTGPYIQNAYVRIRSILRRVENNEGLSDKWKYVISNDEKDILKQLAEFPNVITESANNYDPSSLANYNYQMAKSFHKFYHDYRIIGAESEGARTFRLLLINCVAKVLKSSMELLGIEMPERM